jgi:predicted nicotinamide N-methyase
MPPPASADTLCQRPIPGGWTDQRMEFAGRQWDILLPANPDAFLEEIDSWTEVGTDPDIYWARLWPTALVMSRFIADITRRAGAEGAELLELGCGIGVVGLAALAAGCRVTFSDHVPLAVEVALANAARNGFPAAMGCVFDWKEPRVEQFAGIIASDILYAPSHHTVLLSLFEDMLPLGGTAWIGDPGRYHVSTFIKLANERGFLVDVVNERNQRLTAPTSGEFQLIQLRRHAAAAR